MIVTAAELNSTTCPPWCQRDHAVDPANHHAGRLDVTENLELFLTDMPGEGVTAELYGREAEAYEGGIALSVAEIARLAAVFSKLTAALTAAAINQQT